MHQIRLSLGSAPDAAGGPYSDHPDGPLKSGGGRKKRREGKGEEERYWGKGEEIEGKREGFGPHKILGGAPSRLVLLNSGYAPAHSTVTLTFSVIHQSAAPFYRQPVEVFHCVV